MSKLENFFNGVLGCLIILILDFVLLWILAFLGVPKFEMMYKRLFGGKKEQVEQINKDSQWNGTFTGRDHNKGKKCSVSVGAGGGYCSCPGCEPKHWDAFTCDRCGHKCERHTR